MSTKVIAELDGRADVVVAKAFPDAGRRQLARMFDAGEVKLRGKKLAKGDRVATGDEIELANVPASGAALTPVSDPDALARLDVLLERADLVAVCKPAGMPSQPLRAGELGTAANGIAARWPECAGLGGRDGGVVHRLDIGTSGVLVAARTEESYRALREAFSASAVAKEYLALVVGSPVSRECEASLAQRGDHVVIDEADGLAAHTTFVVERASATHALVKCVARTGRMHQVRAHLAIVGAPIAGDALYKGVAIDGHDGFFLHAAKLVLADGTSIEAPLPARFTAALAAVGL